jgi:trans-2,3-dihydro-3-hydroxyanthranilate isomerase
MTTRPYRYLHLDVFTSRPFEGNQLAVFPEATGLSTDTMQRIAREMAFSETTFVLPRERPDTDVRMRIFTPGRELPMAGHPVIGSTVALAHDGLIARGQQRFVFGLGVGPLPVDLEWGDTYPSFVWMTQLRPVFGPTFDDVAAVARVLGVEEREIRDVGTPVQQISCGVPYVLVPMISREAVDRAAFNDLALRDLALSPDVEPAFFLFSVAARAAADEPTAYSRMFAPGVGVVEDPATGSASGPLGCYLLKHGLVTPDRARAMTSLQGVKMQRPSRLHISIAGTPDAITEVKVGGEAIVVGDGRLVAV